MQDEARQLVPCVLALRSRLLPEQFRAEPQDAHGNYVSSTPFTAMASPTAGCNPGAQLRSLASYTDESSSSPLAVSRAHIGEVKAQMSSEFPSYLPCSNACLLPQAPVEDERLLSHGLRMKITLCTTSNIAPAHRLRPATANPQESRKRPKHAPTRRQSDTLLTSNITSCVSA